VRIYDAIDSKAIGEVTTTQVVLWLPIYSYDRNLVRPAIMVLVEPDDASTIDIRQSRKPRAALSLVLGKMR
jgi:hypothetical protein